MAKLFEKLLTVFIFLLPLSTVFIFDEKFLGGDKWQFGTGVIYASEIILWLVFIIFVINQIKAGNKISIASIKDKIKKPDYKVTITLSLWLLLAYAGISILWSAEKSAGWYLWFHMLEAGMLFFIFLGSEFRPQKVLGALTLSGAIQGLLATQQFISQKVVGQKLFGLVTRLADQPGGLVIEANNGRWLRASGTFNDPNLLSGFLAISLLAGCLFYTQTKYKKITLSLIVLMTFGLFFTFSRGSLIALIIGLIILLISQKNNWKQLIMPSVAIITALVTLIIIFSPLAFSRASTSGRLEQKSIQERLTQNDTALAVFKQHPLLGVGLNNYTYHLYQQHPGLPAHKYQEVENIYLLLLAELGLIGLFFFILLILSITWRSLKTNNYQGLTFLVTILILGIFYHYPLTQFPGIIMLIIALFLAIQSNPKLIDLNQVK